MTTASIANGAVTAPKIDFATLHIIPNSTIAGNVTGASGANRYGVTRTIDGLAPNGKYLIVGSATAGANVSSYDTYDLTMQLDITTGTGISVPISRTAFLWVHACSFSAIVQANSSGVIAFRLRVNAGTALSLPTSMVTSGFRVG